MMLFIKWLLSMYRQELRDAALTYSTMAAVHEQIRSDQLTGLSRVSQVVQTGTAGDPTVPQIQPVALITAGCSLRFLFIWWASAVRHWYPTIQEIHQLSGQTLHHRKERLHPLLREVSESTLEERELKKGGSDHSTCCSVLLLWLLWCFLLWLQRFNYGRMEPPAFKIPPWTQSGRRGHFHASSLAVCSLNGGFRWSRLCSWFSTGEQRCFMLGRWENLIRSDEWSHSLSLCFPFSVIKRLCVSGRADLQKKGAPAAWKREPVKDYYFLSADHRQVHVLHRLE